MTTSKRKTILVSRSVLMAGVNSFINRNENNKFSNYWTATLHLTIIIIYFLIFKKNFDGKLKKKKCDHDIIIMCFV